MTPLPVSRAVGIVTTAHLEPDPMRASDSRVALILPDGRLDFGAADLVPADVPLIPLTPENGFNVAQVRLADKLLNIQSGPYPGKPAIPWPESSHCTYDEFFAFDEEAQTVSRNYYVRDFYVACRLKGESSRMAEMLATRSFPGLKTDSIFNEGKFSEDRGKIGPEQLWLRQQAEAAGVNISGTWYCKGLASYPGDPTAWVRDRSDVLRIAREKNMTVHGYVEHKGHEVEPMVDVPIADDIIENEVLDILDANPGLKAEDVREKVYELRTGAIDPNPQLVTDHNFEWEE